MNERYRSVHLEGLPKLDGMLVKECVKQMGDNKTCADDGMVSEMLKALPSEAWEPLADIFKLRLLNVTTEDSEKAWDKQGIILLEKKKMASWVKYLRPIWNTPSTGEGVLNGDSKNESAVVIFKVKGATCIQETFPSGRGAADSKANNRKID